MEPLRGLVHHAREAVSTHKDENAEYTGLRVLCDPKNATVE